MKLPKIAVFLAPMLLAALLQTLAVADDVDQQLRSQYLDKVLTLRHFYQGEHLAFQSDGTLIGTAEEGPWTLNGQISVDSIRLNERVLQIHARRVYLIFDAKGNPYRDLLAYLAESKVGNKGDIEQSYRRNHLDIKIMLTSSNPTVEDISAAMSAVFLTSGQSVWEITPDFWREYSDQIEGRPRSDQSFAEKVYTVKLGEVSAPRSLYQPDPEFSEAARKAAYQGKMTLSLVVDPSGSVRDLQIVSPLGLGMDEQAVEAVRTWKFEPGMKEGQPVPVKIAVEVSFQLF